MWSEKAVFALLFVACLNATASSVNETQELFFSYITTINSVQFEASGGIPAVDLALEEINNSSFVLANYTLKYETVLDSKVSSLINRNYSANRYNFCLRDLPSAVHRDRRSGCFFP